MMTSILVSGLNERVNTKAKKRHDYVRTTGILNLDDCRGKSSSECIKCFF
jgi:hypothetical protein